jgi:diadenosine tetraphosphate (Ap4A) HIT family hydrolase
VSCDLNTRLVEMPIYERIAADKHWRVAHAAGVSLAGWLVLLPRRHVTAVADLNDAEAASLGWWQVRLSRALHAVFDCSKTYVAQFAEKDGHRHVHFHLVPRPPDLAEHLRGPAIFALLGRPPSESRTEKEMNDTAIRLRHHLY